jgi:hypothetical protein
MRNGLACAFLLAISIGCAAATPAEQEALTGSWGGPHISLELTKDGGRVEYDCAHGTIAGPVVLDREGRFEAAGTHSAEHPGPVREEDERREGQPVRYRGKVSGETLTLTVTPAGSNETNEEIGTFTLTRGATPRLMKCL